MTLILSGSSGVTSPGETILGNLSVSGSTTGDNVSLIRFVSSWKGHAKWANSHNLITKLRI